MKIKALVEKKIELIKKFHEKPVENLANLMPSIIVGLAFIIHLINYVIFIMEGGYRNPIQQNGMFDFDGILQSFTKGETNNFLEQMETPMLVVLVLFGICLMLYLIIVNTKNKKMIVVNALMIGVLLGIFFWFDAVNTGRIELSERQIQVLVNIISKMGIKTIFLIYCLLLLVTVGMLLYMTWKSQYLYLLKDLVFAGLLGYFAIPFIFIVIKNIKPILFMGRALLVLIVIVGFILGMIGLFSSSGSSSTREEENDVYVKRQNVKPLNINKPDDNMWVVPSGIMVYKVHGSMHDYVERSNSLGGCSEVCSLDDLRKGKFLIYDSKGRRLGENDITWKVK